MIIEKQEDGSFDTAINTCNINLSEALGALLALGYTEREAESAIKKANKEDSLENIIKSCLKILMG
jgi:Holliday junction DNA helicase RuvA